MLRPLVYLGRIKFTSRRFYAVDFYDFGMRSSD
jgi:hypothetical protein